MLRDCGVHDVDLFMHSVHNATDLIEWLLKYSLFFGVTILFLVIIFKAVFERKSHGY
jgi:hypothetical protein